MTDTPSNGLPLPPAVPGLPPDEWALSRRDGLVHRLRPPRRTDSRGIRRTLCGKTIPTPNTTFSQLAAARAAAEATACSDCEPLPVTLPVPPPLFARIQPARQHYTPPVRR